MDQRKREVWEKRAISPRVPCANPPDQTRRSALDTRIYRTTQKTIFTFVCLQHFSSDVGYVKIGKEDALLAWF